MIDIQGGLRPMPTSPAPVRPETQTGASASAAHAALPEMSRPKIVDIVRPEIKVDVEGDNRRLQVAVERMNAKMVDGGRGLNFHIDPALNQPVVTVTNKETGEVIRQIPNETIVQLAHSLEDTKGLLHNAKV